MKTAFITLASVITISFFSCQRNIDHATITVDTVETDFFEVLEEANAKKTYEGEMTWPGFKSRFIQLLIDESKMTFTLNDTYLSEDGKDSVSVQKGEFRKNTNLESQEVTLELVTENNEAFIFFQAFGDTLLKKLNLTGEATEEFSLKRL